MLLWQRLRLVSDMGATGRVNIVTSALAAAPNRLEKMFHFLTSCWLKNYLKSPGVSRHHTAYVGFLKKSAAIASSVLRELVRLVPSLPSPHTFPRTHKFAWNIASPSGSVGSYRLVRTATTDACVCGVLSGDVCLFVCAFSCLHFCCSAFNTR